MASAKDTMRRGKPAQKVLPQGAATRQVAADEVRHAPSPPRDTSSGFAAAGIAGLPDDDVGELLADGHEKLIEGAYRRVHEAAAVDRQFPVRIVAYAGYQQIPINNPRQTVDNPLCLPNLPYEWAELVMVGSKQSRMPPTDTSKTVSFVRIEVPHLNEGTLRFEVTPPQQERRVTAASPALAAGQNDIFFQSGWAIGFRVVKDWEEFDAE